MAALHLSTYHPQATKPGQLLSFTCLVCNSCFFDTERHYFEHLGCHLKKFETVTCVFKGCEYKTNIYSTFHSHKSRKHNSHSVQDFKTYVFHECQGPTEVESGLNESENHCDSVLEEDLDSNKTFIKRLDLLLHIGPSDRIHYQLFLPPLLKMLLVDVGTFEPFIL